MKFKIGDKLQASTHDKHHHEIEYVTITSINEENQVYHWEAPEPLGGTIHSGYFFKEAKLYTEIEDDNWCHYSGMPSPSFYQKNKL